MSIFSSTFLISSKPLERKPWLKFIQLTVASLFIGLICAINSVVAPFKVRNTFLTLATTNSLYNFWLCQFVDEFVLWFDLLERVCAALLAVFLIWIVWTFLVAIATFATINAFTTSTLELIVFANFFYNNFEWFRRVRNKKFYNLVHFRLNNNKLTTFNIKLLQSWKWQGMQNNEISTSCLWRAIFFINAIITILDTIAFEGVW